MPFRGNAEQKLLKIRAPLVAARAVFATAVNNSGFLLNRGTPASSSAPTFRALISPAEYIAGTVFISKTGGSYPRTYATSGGGEFPSEGEAPPTFLGTWGETADDFSGASLLRGYIQPITLTDYLTTHSYSSASELVTRAWVTRSMGSVDVFDVWAPLSDLTTQIPIDDTARLSNYVVPVITWFYTNQQGRRVSDAQTISISAVETANRGEYTTRQYLASTGLEAYRYIAETNSFSDTVYYSLSPPYVSSVDTVANWSTRYGVGVGNIAHAVNPDGTTAGNIVVTQNDAPYLMVALLSDGRTTNDLYPVVQGAGVNVGLPSDRWGFTGQREIIPIYPNVDAVINYFADFGVVVTTDWDEVLNPTPTPEEDAKVNPDPTDRILPNFPDNTTDETPIEPTYITPATFGQALIYTPTTLRNVLTWVSDSTVNIDNWKRLFANPADVITGINLFNLDIVAHDTTRVTAQEQTNILGVTTDIPNYVLNDGYNNVIDGGRLTLQAYYGNYADFTSMTYQMFIPFVGFTTLRACDVVNHELHLYYAVDFSSGAAVAFVNSDNKLIYTAPCTVAGKIPLSVSDRNSQTINNTLTALGSVGSLIGGVASGNVAAGVGGLFSSLGGLQLQTNYANRGSLSSVNIYKLLPAFVERTRYDLFLPSGEQTYLGAAYQSVTGAPTTEFTTLANAVDANGYIECEFVKLNSSTATEEEQEQIISLLKSGVYL